MRRGSWRDPPARADDGLSLPCRLRCRLLLIHLLTSHGALRRRFCFGFSGTLLPQQGPGSAWPCVSTPKHRRPSLPSEVRHTIIPHVTQNRYLAHRAVILGRRASLAGCHRNRWLRLRCFFRFSYPPRRSRATGIHRLPFSSPAEVQNAGRSCDQGWTAVGSEDDEWMTAGSCGLGSLLTFVVGFDLYESLFLGDVETGSEGSILGFPAWV